MLNPSTASLFLGEKMNNTTVEKRHYATSADYYNPIDDLLEKLRLTKEEEQILAQITLFVDKRKK